MLIKAEIALRNFLLQLCKENKLCLSKKSSVERLECCQYIAIKMLPITLHYHRDMT